jgi:hypothetical protein
MALGIARCQRFRVIGGIFCGVIRGVVRWRQRRQVRI